MCLLFAGQSKERVTNNKRLTRSVAAAKLPGLNDFDLYPIPNLSVFLPSYSLWVIFKLYKSVYMFRFLHDVL